MSAVPPNVTEERRRAVGILAEESAVMELMLRIVFSALLGSKYATVICARQPVSWLVENCRAVVKLHHAISESDRDALMAALSAVETANDGRNQFIHVVWGDPTDGVMSPLRSRWRSHKSTSTATTLTDLAEAAESLSVASEGLFAATVAALGIESLDVEEQLRNEDSQP